MIVREARDGWVMGGQRGHGIANPCICMPKYVCMYVSSVYLYTYMCVCMYPRGRCMYMYLYVFICVCMYLYVFICIYMCVCIPGGHGDDNARSRPWKADGKGEREDQGGGM